MSVFPLLVSFLVTFASAPLFRLLALHFDILDHPEVRKFQKSPIPLLGGAAVFLGLIAGSCFAPLRGQGMFAIFFGALLIFVVSVIDDKIGLSARFRMAAQVIAASMLIFSGLRISFFPNTVFGNAAEIAITYIWIIGITNAFNYLDGIDGLCCGLGFISSFFFFLIFAMTRQQEFIFLPLVMMGACLGFIPHNFKAKKMFLGDGGSMVIGYLASAVALVGNWAGDAFIKITVPILILGVPIFDMTFTTIMRYKEKKIRTLIQWLEYAGRDHFHHYLIDLGLHSLGALLFIFAVNISMGISALIIAESDSAFYGALTILKGAIMFGLIAVLMVLGRRLHKEHDVRDRMGI